jgi:hypothetical protein
MIVELWDKLQQIGHPLKFLSLGYIIICIFIDTLPSPSDILVLSIIFVPVKDELPVTSNNFLKS